MEVLGLYCVCVLPKYYCSTKFFSKFNWFFLVWRLWCTSLKILGIVLVCHLSQKVENILSQMCHPHQFPFLSWSWTVQFPLSHICLNNCAKETIVYEIFLSLFGFYIELTPPNPVSKLWGWWGKCFVKLSRPFRHDIELKAWKYGGWCSSVLSCPYLSQFPSGHKGREIPTW